MAHDNPVRGHAGYEKTYQRVKRDFYWKGMKREVRQHIQHCRVCQHNKYETALPAGLLQPLPIPNRPWSDISMDFIYGLPLSKGYSVIFVVVDRLTKYSHFIALSHPYSAKSVAQAFIQHVFKLHDLTNTIVSDRETIFTSNFWQELFRMQGTKLHYSTSYHPQTDGQTEAVNKCIECYLRCVIGDKPKE